MAQHDRLRINAGIQVYFCDPQSPWQRGSNENTNRLLRQYFPKSTDLSRYTQAQLNKVARELNDALDAMAAEARSTSSGPFGQ